METVSLVKINIKLINFTKKLLTMTTDFDIIKLHKGLLKTTRGSTHNFIKGNA